MSFKDTFKSLIDPYSDDDQSGFIDEVDMDDDAEQHSIFSMFRSGSKSSSSRKAAPAPRPSRNPIRQRSSSRPAAKAPAAKGGDVRVFRPTEYEAAWDIVSAMVSGETVVVNLENTRADIGMRIMDFVLGAAFARRDELQRVSDRTFIITPRGRALTGDILDGPMSSDSARF